MTSAQDRANARKEYNRRKKDEAHMKKMVSDIITAGIFIGIKRITNGEPEAGRASMKRAFRIAKRAVDSYYSANPSLRSTGPKM